MHKLIDYICDELDDLERKSEKNKLSMSEIQYGDTLAHFKKNLLAAEGMAEGKDYSSRSGSSYMRGGSYDDRSYARGGRGRRGGANQYGSYADGGYSRDGGAEDLIEAIRSMMQDLPPETQREAGKFIQKLEQM